MTRKLLKILPVLLGIFFYCNALDARNPAKPAKAKAGKSFLGEVVNSQSLAHAIVVRQGKTEREFDVSAARLKGYTALSDIKVGDRVNVVYRQKKEGRLSANSIERKPELHTLAGTVTAVLPSTSALEVRRRAGDQERRFDAAAARFRGYSCLEDIRTGDRVSVQFEERDGGSLARVISRRP